MRSTLVALALCATAQAASAGDMNSINATIPFDFTAGDQQFRSGAYSIEIQPGTGRMSIKPRRGAPAILRAMNLTFLGDVYEVSNRYEILVRRYEGESYLDAVWIQHNGMGLLTSASEKARQERGEQPKLLRLKLKP